MKNGDLMWNFHNGRDDGTPRWALPNGRRVGIGWQGAEHVFAGHNGVIYAVYGTQMLWNRHQGRDDGTFRWSLEKGVNVANGFNKTYFWRAQHIFAGSTPGIIYAIVNEGDLVWFRHDGWDDGSARWQGDLTYADQGKKVGTGWDVLDAFSGGDGIIYAVMKNGDLRWNRHDGRNDGTPRWALDGGKPVGSGWNVVKHAFSG